MASMSRLLRCQRNLFNPKSVDFMLFKRSNESIPYFTKCAIHIAPCLSIPYLCPHTP